MDSTGSLSGRSRHGRNLRLAALLAAVAALTAACGDSSPSAGAAPTPPAGCTAITSPKVLGAQHIQVGAKATYNTSPPTSGNHYPSPAPAGGYKDPIPNEVQVHNLEHGHIMVQHRGLTGDQIDALELVVTKDAKMVVMAPYPDMDAAVAFTSWGKLQTCSAWSDSIPELATYFIRQNRDHAPESIP
jgi:uncharacterized protein DUF3105